MKRSKIVPILIVMALLASNAACSSQNKEDLEDLAESSAVTSETMASTTIQKATEPVVIVQETMPEIITTPTEAITELEKGIEYLRVLPSSRISDGSYFLLSEQDVKMIDVQVADGIVAEDLGSLSLTAGTILVPLDAQHKPSMELTKDTIFVMLDGRCVTFDMTVGQEGEPRFNGLAEANILGRRVYSEYKEMVVKETGELLAMEEPDPNLTVMVLTISTDWNEDGVKDTFRRELIEGSEEQSGTLIFTDGATGEATDVTQYCGTRDNGFFDVLTNGAYLFEDEEGNRMILDSFDVCSGDVSTFIYTYDPETILAQAEIYGDFDVDHGELFLLRNSTVFGNLEQMIYAVTIEEGDFRVWDKSMELYWAENRDVVEPASSTPSVFTCALQELTAERITGDVVETIKIPAGVAIFPLYTILDESGVGVLYFRTLADGDCQISYCNYEYGESASEVTFGGKAQTDLFWCAFGG